MKTISEKIYFVDITGNFYDINGEKTDANKILSDQPFCLLLHDEYFFYETINDSLPKTSKLKLIIKNYLSGSYPEEFLEKIYLVKNNKLIAAIPSEKFLNFNSVILQKAKKVSTPAIELYIKGEKTSIFYKNVEIKISEDIVYIPNKSGKTSKLNDYNFSDLSYNIFKDDKKADYKHFVIPSIIYLIALIIFVAGNILKTKSLDNKVAYLNSKINEIYKKAGINDKVDPYGKLLFKAQRNLPKSLYILDNYYYISQSFANTDTIDTLNFNDNSFKISGKTSDFKSLDVIKNNLSRYYSVVEILNTKIDKDFLQYSLKVSNEKN